MADNNRLGVGASIGLGLGSQIGGSLLDNTLGYAFKSSYQDEQYKKQWNQWKKMTDYVNAYNTPLAQMGRLRQAGLNPALLYSGVNNTSGATASVGGDVSAPPQNKHMGPLDYMAIESTRQQQQAQKLQNELLEEQVEQAKIATDEARQKHIGNVYSFQNAFRQAVAQGGLLYNPNLADLWQDRSGTYNFRSNDNGLGEEYRGRGFGFSGSDPVQYDSALLSGYMLGRLYHDNNMKEYNTHEKDEARINTQNERDRQNAQLEYENVEDNYKLLKSLYHQGISQDYEYNRRTFDSMTNAAISGFKEAIAKNNLLALIHAGGYLGNESPLLRFFGKKTGHEGWDNLYSPSNYLKIKGDALLDAISQMGVDVLGAYLGRGAKRPYDSHDIKIGHQSWRDYK